MQVMLKSGVTAAEQIKLMEEDALYDVSDTPGIDQDILLADIHARPNPPKVPKVFLSNNCVFNCAYCGCRCSNDDRRRYCLEPLELAKLAVAQAEDNGRGIFVTSAINQNADHTEELIVETIRHVRETLHYKGYVHAKIMPGADPLLIKKAGLYANRLSVNIEVARNVGYEMVAKQKNRRNILTPMGQITQLIQAEKDTRSRFKSRFATSQSTQLMAGATGENDRTIITLAQALYAKYRLARVYYTAFTYRYPARGYDLPFVITPKWRMARLYQADRLMELYGFTPEELAPPEAANLEPDMDPKAAWALRNLHLFPIEVNTADYELLLRIPGIGTTFAEKIITLRKYRHVSHESLRKMRVSMKRCRNFITCDGKFEGSGLSDSEERLRASLVTGHAGAEQLTLEEASAGCMI